MGDESVSKIRIGTTKRPAGEPPPLEWLMQAQYVAVLERGDRKLGVTVQVVDARWGVLAIETSISAVTADDVFNNHAHQIVGDYNSPAAAFAAAEGYARAWARGFKSATLPHCACEEIGG